MVPSEGHSADPGNMPGPYWQDSHPAAGLGLRAPLIISLCIGPVSTHRAEQCGGSCGPAVGWRRRVFFSTVRAWRHSLLPVTAPDTQDVQKHRTRGTVFCVSSADPPWPQTQKEQGRPLPAQALVPGPGLDPGGPNSFPTRMSIGIKLDTLYNQSTPSSLSLLHPDSPAHSCQRHPPRCLTQNPGVSLDLCLPYLSYVSFRRHPCAQVSVHPLGWRPLTLQGPEGGGTISPVGHWEGPVGPARLHPSPSAQLSLFEM